jgi:hypothetical protein
MGITTFEQLLERAAVAGARRVAVVGADSPSARAAVDAAAERGLAIPVLVGDPLAIRARIAAGRLVRLREAEIVRRSDHAARPGGGRWPPPAGRHPAQGQRAHDRVLRPCWTPATRSAPAGC